MYSRRYEPAAAPSGFIAPAVPYCNLEDFFKITIIRYAGNPASRGPLLRYLLSLRAVHAQGSASKANLEIRNSGMDLFLPDFLSSRFDSSHQKFHRCEIARKSPKDYFYLAGGDDDVPGERDGTGEEGATGGDGASGGGDALGGDGAGGGGGATGADGEDGCLEDGAGLGEARGLVLGVAEGPGFCMGDKGSGGDDNPGGLAAVGVFCSDIMATWLCRVS